MKTLLKKLKRKKKIRLMLGGSLLFLGYRSHINKDLINELKIDAIKYDHSKKMYDVSVSFEGVVVYPYILILEHEKDYMAYRVWKRVCIKYSDGPMYYKSLSEYVKLIEKPCELILLKYRYFSEQSDVSQTNEPDEILYGYRSLDKTIKEFTSLCAETSAKILKLNKSVIEYHTCSAMYRFRDYADMMAAAEAEE